MKKLLLLFLVLFVPAAEYARLEQTCSGPYLWKLVGTAGFSDGPSIYLSLASDPAGTLYLAYKDYGHGGKATVMTFDGNDWTAVGMPGFSAGEVWFTSLAVDPSGRLYLAYEDASVNYRATVMTFDGADWVPVGQPGFTAGTANYTSVAINPQAPYQPCVAFMDGAAGNKASVRCYNGTAWVSLGPQGFSPAEAEYVSLAFSPAGIPCVAFQDYSQLRRASVMKFTSPAWNYVGNAGFSLGTAHYTGLSFSPSGDPHVAYWDETLHGIVSRFNGISWENLGFSSFSTGEVRYPGVAFKPGGQLYVGFIDVADSHTPKVLYCTGTGWASPDPVGVSAGSADFSSLAVSGAGKLYVAFQDMDHGAKATVKTFDSVYVGTPGKIRNDRVRIGYDPLSRLLCADLTEAVAPGRRICLFNSAGQEILSAAVTGTRTCLDAGNIPPGVYLVRIRTVSGDHYVKVVLAGN
jgi:hypothetical protein